MKEVWRDIPGYKDLYQVSDSGLIKRISSNKVLKNIIRKGYYSVSLSKEGKVKHLAVHRLVASAFIENFVLSFNGVNCINHIDGDKKNNHISNLEKASYKENNDHARQVGLVRTGPRNPRKVASPEIIIKIEDFIKNNMNITNVKIGIIFGVSPMTISNINRGQYCKETQNRFNYPIRSPYYNKKNKLDEVTVYKIKKLLSSKMYTQKQISIIFNVSRSVIASIHQGVTYRDI